MRKSRFTDEPIIRILKEQVAGQPTVVICLQRSLSEGTYYGWKSKYGGMEVSEAKRLKSLEEESRRLKFLLSGAYFEI